MEHFDVIVVGAGPAGLLAAGRAAELGAKVLVLEKMKQEGRKLLITGKGRCNITNDADIGGFITHVYPKGRFLRNAFSQYFSKDIIDLLQKYGVESTLERGGRYFPTSNKSADVLHALLKWTKELKVDIRCGQKVEQIHVENKLVTGLRASGKNYKSTKVILATGGKSYPATGSNGEGYVLAKTLGHSIQKTRPALVPLEAEGEIAQKLEGLNLKNVNAVVWVDGKKAGEAFGEMTFTDFGLSGPIILTLSRMVGGALENGSQVKISVDLKPALDEQKLEQRLLRDLNENGKKQIAKIFPNWLPSKLIPVFMDVLALDATKECHQISGKERKQIRFLLKNLSFNISKTRPFKEAIITVGGISTKEISPKTMESKIIGGLYFAGEIVDLDAETGGYNLQIAYSTGWLAGNSSANSL